MNWKIRFHISDSDTDLFWISPNATPGYMNPGNPMEYHIVGAFPGDLIRFMYLDLSQLGATVKTIAAQIQDFAETHEAVCEKRALQELNQLVKLHPFFMITELEWQSRMLGVISAEKDGAASKLPLDQLIDLPFRLRQVQRACLELISQVLDIDLGKASIQGRMQGYAERHRVNHTPCYEFRKLTTKYEQIGGVYLERLYPTDIFDLIDYSLQRCLEKELRFRVCKNCGRYFAISRSAKAEYCDTFPDENGRTCRNVGAITAWTKKRESDDVFMTYRREYKKRFARIRSGTLLPEDFYRWSEQARQKKNQLEAGEIDVDTFLAWLANS